MSKLIIGFTGKKGSGKDTCAAALTSIGVQQVAFADQLKGICMEIFGLSRSQVYGTLEQKETVDSRWGLSPREILQKFGTEVGRDGNFDTFRPHVPSIVLYQAFKTRGLAPGKNIWVDYVLGKIMESTAHEWAITDCRFLNEAEAIKKAGGYILKVERAGHGTGAHETHASEMEQEKIVPDYLLENDGTIGDLQALTLSAYKNIYERRNV